MVWDEREGDQRSSPTPQRQLRGNQQARGTPSYAPYPPHQWSGSYFFPAQTLRQEGIGASSGMNPQQWPGSPTIPPLGYFMGLQQGMGAIGGLVTEQGERPHIAYGDVALPLGGAFGPLGERKDMEG